MNSDWGTDENWVRAALDISAGLIDETEDVKSELIKYIDRNSSWQFRLLAHEILEKNGILDSAKSLAREMGRDISF